MKKDLMLELSTNIIKKKLEKIVEELFNLQIGSSITLSENVWEDINNLINSIGEFLEKIADEKITISGVEAIAFFNNTMIKTQDIKNAIGSEINNCSHTTIIQRTTIADKFYYAILDVMLIVTRTEQNCSYSNK